MFGGWTTVDPHPLIECDRALTRHRYVPRLFASPILGRLEPMIRDYRTVLASLYEAIRQTSGCNVIIDSSKDAPWGYIVRGAPGVRMRTLHLVRDSRGVVYSWGKRSIPQPQYANNPILRHTTVARRPTVHAALHWDLTNALVHWLSASGTPTQRLHYESLVRDPDTAIYRAYAFAYAVDHERCQIRLERSLESPEFAAPAHHTLGGNRVRFHEGPLRLRPDVEWQQRMSAGDKVVATALTFPLLVAYGYLNPSGRTAD
jgi:hypothetical protein